MSDLMVNGINVTEVKVSVDHTEGEEFVSWLNEQGIDASIGGDTGNYINGIGTWTWNELSDVMNILWGKYCNS